MEMDSFIIDGLKEFLKRHKTEITINDTNKKIFLKLIKSRNIINKIQNNKRIKRFIQTIIFNTKNKNYKCKKITYLEKNKYIFILISLIISLIIYSQNNILEKNLTRTSEILNYIYLFVLKLFKSKLVSFDYINLFFHLFFELIEKNVIDFNQKIEKILYILLVYKKFLKNLGEIYYDNQDNQIKKVINKSMYEILRKIFVMNNNNNIAFIKCCNFFSEKTNILEILKIAYNYYDNNIISDDNKRMIKSNLIKNFTYNFKKKQFDYLYFILKKFLRNFNNKNSSKRTYDNNISLISGINEFILDIYKSETDKIIKNEYYFDKYFIFDSNEKNSGIKAGPIQFDKSHRLISLKLFAPNSDLVEHKFLSKQGEVYTLVDWYGEHPDEKKALIRDNILAKKADRRSRIKVLKRIRKAYRKGKIQEAQRIRKEFDASPAPKRQRPLLSRLFKRRERSID